jgi:hypothetical protein
MNAQLIKTADQILDWYNRRKEESQIINAEKNDADSFLQELAQLRADRDAQLTVLTSIKTCGCGRCGR